MRGVVSKITDHGVVVKLNEYLSGFITRMHLSDLANPQKHPKNKFKVHDFSVSSYYICR